MNRDRHLFGFIPKFAPRAANRTIWTAAAISAASAMSATATGQVFGGFGAPEGVLQGLPATDVAIDDLDGDGDADLAVTITGTGNHRAVALLGDGAGNFVVQGFFAVGTSPESVAIGDLDGDGANDLAVAFSNSGGGVSILLGLGDGTFAGEQRYAAGSRPESVAIGDFDGDGAQDLAVANGNSDDVSVLLGLGDGTFAAEQRYGAGNGPSSVVIGDLNRDGAADLAIANQAEADVSVLLGNGDGTFAAEERFEVGDRPGLVALGDLDGDGVADLVTVSNQFAQVSVLLGVGDGAFAPEQRYGTEQAPRSVAIDDLDGDGDMDLAVACFFFGNGRLSVLLGAGDGTLGSAQNFSVLGTGLQSMALGDFDGNDSPDVVVAGNGDSDVIVRLNETDVLPPGAFDLLSPPDGSTGLPLPDAILAWPGGSGAAPVDWSLATGFSNTYTVAIALDPALQSVVFEESGIDGTSFDVPTGALEQGTTYYWSVTAENQAGTTVSTPTAFTFTTAAPADFDGDGVVGSSDLGALLAAWGLVD